MTHRLGHALENECGAGSHRVSKKSQCEPDFERSHHQGRELQQSGQEQTAPAFEAGAEFTVQRCGSLRQCAYSHQRAQEFFQSREHGAVAQ